MLFIFFVTILFVPDKTYLDPFNEVTIELKFPGVNLHFFPVSRVGTENGLLSLSMKLLPSTRLNEGDM